MKLFVFPSRSVTVSLTDGTAISGKTAFCLPGKIKIRHVKVGDDKVPGVVIVPQRSILTVQVMP